MKRFLYLIVFLAGFAAFAQPDGAEVTSINGKKYYVHFVQEGNTLYGIHKLYNTPLESILNANEGLTDNLSVGQKILIPISTDDASFYNKHVVKEGETLYGISKQYNCSVEDLQNLNKGLNAGIKPGQEIIVPGKTEVIPENNGEGVTTDPEVTETNNTYNVSYQDSIVNHVVLDHETLYSISKRYMVSMDTIRTLNGIRNNKIKPGQTIKIPIKKVNYTILEKDITQLTIKDFSLALTNQTVKKESYKVALLMPFMFAKNDALMNKPLKIGEEREMYPLTKICFEFYQGFKLAADSLAQAGLNVELLVYDTKNDSGEVARIFAKTEMENVDLVVGPLYQKTINAAVAKCEEKEINIILPFKANAKVLHQNPHVFSTVTSNMTLYDGMVDYIVENHTQHKVILLKPQYGDLTLYNRVRDRFNELIKEKPNAYASQLTDIPMGSSGGRDINVHIAKDTVNVVIVPSTDVKIVSGCLNRLNKVMNINSRAKQLKIVVFGVEDWNKMDDLDILHKVRLNHHYASYRHTDFNKAKGLGFVRSFRSKFAIDPTVYSTQGFDVGMYFMAALKLYGTQFQSYLHLNEINQVQNAFNFQKIADDGGYENKGTIIVRYSGYELEKMN